MNQVWKRRIGTNAAERIGSVLIAVGVVWLLWWIFTQTHISDHGWAGRTLQSIVDGPLCAGRYSDCSGTRWPTRAILVGVTLRFIFTPAYRWVRTGETRP